MTTKKKTTGKIETIMNNVIAPVPSKVAKEVGKRRPVEPVELDNPKDELHRLVRLHKRWTRTYLGWLQSVTDKNHYEPNGEKTVIKCTVPETHRHDLTRVANGLKAEAKGLETAMLVQLEQLPIYEHFLSKVWGFGPVVSSYIASMVQIERCVKPSQLWRYCGNACDPRTGGREIRSGAPKYKPDGTQGDGTGTYNDELKMRIWQGMIAMRKNAVKFSVCDAHKEMRPSKASVEAKAEFRALTMKCAECMKTRIPYGTETKYTKRWLDAVYSRSTMPQKYRMDPNGNQILRNGKPIPVNAEQAGRRKATDLVLEDLYIVWRTLAGLPVWPDLYSVRRGFYHGGKPCVNEGRVLTLEEARARHSCRVPAKELSPDTPRRSNAR